MYPGWELNKTKVKTIYLKTKRCHVWFIFRRVILTYNILKNSVGINS